MNSYLVPAPTPESEFFWAGLRRRELMLPFCLVGQTYFFPPMPGCPDCGAEPDHIEHRRASGTGVVYSWTDAHYAFDPEFADEVPYTIVAVDLVEGVRIYGRWARAAAPPQAGLEVAATYDDRGEFTLLGFAPKAGGQ